MLQTLLALAIVLAAAGWLGWRALRPLLARAGAVPAKDGCACGDGGGACEPKVF
ncbi:MAG TPA: hypothetical protein VHY34_09340 [Caulobacteraceae bacterium]|jgi:hypothetical protein|nr:hypothetical protein [Caulobacteraceae bacterium]